MKSYCQKKSVTMALNFIVGILQVLFSTPVRHAPALRAAASNSLTDQINYLKRAVACGGGGLQSWP